MLENRARSLGVDSNIIFHNRFVSDEELAEFLAAADIYVTPYLKPQQITSGTLAYAVGSGKAVISTPYWYASELLADGRGILVPWRDPQAIATEVVGLLGDEAKRRALSERAAACGKDMLWPAVARTYVRSFEVACDRHAERQRMVFQAKTLGKRPAELPEPNLAHLVSMTDATGILQHAAFSVPRYEDGYCVDDNARALLVTALLEDAGTEDVGTVRVARFSLSRLRAARIQSRLRSLQELHVVLPRVARGARVGRQSRASRLGPRDRGGPLRRSGQTEPRRSPVSRRAARPPPPGQPAGLGVRAAGHRRVPARASRARATCSRCARRSEIGSSTCTGGPASPNGHGSRTGSPTAMRASRRR